MLFLGGNIQYSNSKASEKLSFRKQSLELWAYNNLHGWSNMNFHLKNDSVLLSSQKIIWSQVLHFKILQGNVAKINWNTHFGLLFEIST